LRASNRSERTVETYLAAITQLDAFLRERGMPTAVGCLAREHVEAFIAELLQTRSASTASNRFRALQQFFKFLVEEGEIADSPMRRMKPPLVPTHPVDVLSEGQLRALIGTCSSKSFEDRRDEAILRLLVDTGMRRGELLGISIDDLDLDQNVAYVVGNGAVGCRDHAQAARSRVWHRPRSNA
jgi:site-specific recombinase XerD